MVTDFRFRKQLPAKQDTLVSISGLIEKVSFLTKLTFFAALEVIPKNCFFLFLLIILFFTNTS